MNLDKRFKPCSKCGSRDGLRITRKYEYCCMCGYRKMKVPSSNKNLIQDCSVKCPTNNKGKCMIGATKCEPYTLSKQS